MNRSSRGLRLIYPVTAGPLTCRIAEDAGTFTFHLDGGKGGESSAPHPMALQISVSQAGEGLCRDDSGRTHPFAWAWVGPQLHLWLAGSLFIFLHESGRRPTNTPGSQAPGDILAPMPGAVLEVMVAEGDRVERNQTVMLMESMKMELVIASPRNAVVRRVAVTPGQQVERGMRLLELAPDDQEDS